MPFDELKLAFLAHSGLSQDLAHIHVGLAILIGSAIILRCSLADFRPLFVLVALEIVNECLDIIHLGGPSVLGQAQFVEIARDIALTISIPMLICGLARFAPQLLTKQDVADEIRGLPPERDLDKPS